MWHIVSQPVWLRQFTWNSKGVITLLLAHGLQGEFMKKQFGQQWKSSVHQMFQLLFSFGVVAGVEWSFENKQFWAIKWLDLHNITEGLGLKK